MIDLGARIPDLPLALSSGKTARLVDYAGHWLALYFYPKDSTPGCTTEGLEFNALLARFKQRGAFVLGVSRDSIKSHQTFCARQGFAFDLVSDGDESLCRAFDVIHEKVLYGKRHLGVVRSTFLIAPDQTLARAWRKVKVAGHAQAMLDAIPSR